MQSDKPGRGQRLDPIRQRRLELDTEELGGAAVQEWVLHGIGGRGDLLQAFRHPPRGRRLIRRGPNAEGGEKQKAQCHCIVGKPAANSGCTVLMTRVSHQSLIINVQSPIRNSAEAGRAGAGQRRGPLPEGRDRALTLPTSTAMI
jgi:hypothetical protein